MGKQVAVRWGWVGLVLLTGAVAAADAVKSGDKAFAGPKSATSKTTGIREIPAQEMKPRAALTLEGPNVTRWGVVGARGTRVRPSHGLTGDRLFVEGRELDPRALRVELRLGSRSLQLAPRPGGSGARVEFDLRPDAITGSLSASLTARQAGGATALSDAFAVCDRPRISALEPSAIGYSAIRPGVDGYRPFAPGQTMTLRGECLSGLVMQRLEDPHGDLRTEVRVQVRSAAGNGVGRLLLGEAPITASDLAVTYALSAYKPTPFSAQNDFLDRGTLEVVGIPDRPALTVTSDARLRASAAPTPVPARPPPPIIDAVASLETFGGHAVPYVFGQIDDLAQPLALRNRNRVAVKGRNLDPAGGGDALKWQIGDVEIKRVESRDDQQLILHIPANAVTGPICVQAPRSKPVCHKVPVTVVPAYRFTSTPEGLSPSGDGNSVTSLPIRKRLTFTGFDLVPNEAAGLTVEILAVFPTGTPEHCDLGLQIHRRERQRIEFSFGTPGGARPEACDEATEARELGVTSEGMLSFTWRDRATGGNEGISWRIRRARP